MLLAALASLSFAVALDPAGSWARPFVVDRSFTYYGDTSDLATGSDDIDSYACAALRNESGREVVFALSLTEESDIDVMVETPSSSVDVDVHVLSGIALQDRQARDCLDRDDKNATAFHRAAGRYVVVADTYVTSAGVEKPGAFKLWVRVYPTAGSSSKRIAQGVVWHRSSVALGDGFVTANWLDVDVSAGARAQLAYDSTAGGSCHPVANAPMPDKTVAAVNASFFQADGHCTPSHLLRIGGATQQLSSGVEHVVGFGNEGNIGFGAPQAGQDFSSFPFAVGGRGFFNIQVAGVAVDPDGTSGDFVTGRHARTALLARVDGSLTLAAFDGGTEAGLGLSLGELGNALASWDRGLGLNLDGGGSTTLWVKGEPLSGVVNHPADNGKADHLGARAVGAIVVVTADPAPLAPEFVSLPEPGVVLKDHEVFTYAPAFAAGAPELAVQGSIDNATVSGSVFSFAPSDRQNGAFEFVLEACDGHECATQRVPVTVALDFPAPEPQPEPTPVPAPVKPEVAGPTAPPIPPDDPAPRLADKPIVSTPKSGCSAVGGESAWFALLSLSVAARRRARVAG